MLVRREDSVKQREAPGVDDLPETFPGLARTSVKEFPIEALQQSPQMVVTLVRLYELSRRENQTLRRALKRAKVRDILVATGLSFAFNIVIAVGFELFMGDRLLGGPLIAVGFAMAALALVLVLGPASDP